MATTIAVDTLVDAPPDRVWQVLTDFPVTRPGTRSSPRSAESSAQEPACGSPSSPPTGGR